MAFAEPGHNTKCYLPTSSRNRAAQCYHQTETSPGQLQLGVPSSGLVPRLAFMCNSALQRSATHPGPVLPSFLSSPDPMSRERSGERAQRPQPLAGRDREHVICQGFAILLCTAPPRAAARPVADQPAFLKAAPCCTS